MTDYNFLIEIRLSPSQFQVLNHISRISASVGLNLYLVGGAVRDLTYGQNNIRNLDFVVEGNVRRILRVLQSEAARKSGKRRAGSAPVLAAIEIDSINFDVRRNTIALALNNGVQAKIAMAHKEVYVRPGQPPQIIAAGIFEDLRHRDFSANAMAVSLHPNSRGLLLDPTNGALDIENREFRALHSRSFLEDPSRIYRLMRLTLRLGFKVEARTRGWLDAALEAKAWNLLSAEQQGRELRAVLQEENPVRTLRAFAERGLLSGLDRSLSAGKIPLDRLEKIRLAVRSVPGVNPFLLNFDCLVAKLPAAGKKRLALKVMPDAKTRWMALRLEGEARKLAKILGSSKANVPSFVYRLLQSQPQPVVLYLLTHYPQPKIQTRVKSFLFKYPQVRAKLQRAELQAMGVDPGPRSEKILEQLFLATLDGKIKSQAQMTKALRELAGVGSEELGKPPAEARKAKGEKKAAPKTKPARQ